MADDANGLRKILREELKPLNKRLDKVDGRLDRAGERLDALWDQTVNLTEGQEEIKEKLDLLVVSSDRNNENIEKLDKRLTKVEDQLGIVPPPELTTTK